MKKFLFLIIVASLLVSATGCNSNTVTENSSDAANSSVTQSTSESTPPISENSVNSNTSDTPEKTTVSSVEKPDDGKPAYDHVFKGINRNYVQGPPMSYDEVVEILKSDAEHPEWDVDSLFLVETVSVLTLDECQALAGWKDLYADRTMYKVKVMKDLISGETINRDENIFISMGNTEWQNDGDPIYAPGEKFTVVLTKPYKDCDFLRTPAAFALRYDAVEEDGEIVLYSRRSGLDALEMPTSTKIEESVVTSTTLNPAIHSQKLTLTAFADYLREDWENRGLTSHYERTVS